MKKLFTILCIIISLNASSQGFGETYPPKNKTLNTTINQEILDQYMKKDTSNYKEVYCSIVGTGNFLQTKANIEIDFGQKQNYWKRDWLLDEKGEKIVFNSMIDALNYMNDYGWVLHSTMALSSGNKKVYHFVMKKNIKIK